MKTIATLIAASSLLAAQPLHYKIIDLGTLPGGNFSQATLCFSTLNMANSVCLLPAIAHQCNILLQTQLSDRNSCPLSKPAYHFVLTMRRCPPDKGPLVQDYLSPTLRIHSSN